MPGPYTPTQIRTDVITRLTAAAIAPGGVHDTRMLDWPDDTTWPAIAVYSMRGTGSPRSVSLASYEREDVLSVEATTEAADDATLAAALDTLEGQILSTLLADSEWWSRYAPNIRFDVERGRDKDSSRLRGAVQVSFTIVQKEVTYEPAEPSAANSFEQLQVATNIDEGTGSLDAQTDVTQTVTLTGDP